MNAKLAALGKSLFALAIVAALASIASPAQAATLTVNTTDDRDDGSCNASHCSLREAIQAANNHVGPDTISFAIPGPGPHIIAIEGRPPASEHAPPGFWLLNDGTVIDGTTQPGYTGVPMIVLDGSRSLYSYAGGTLSESLNIVSSDSTVRGLSFVGFPIEAIGIEYPSGGGNLIEGNYIGLNPAGLAQGNEVGIVISWDVGPNTIRNNVISGNRDGIRVLGDGQIIQGNLIGLDPTGSAAQENVVGIHLSGGSNWVGGLSAGQGNTISGNTQIGLWINSFNNVVAGNRIGTNAAATAAIPNGVGILVDRDASANDIGLDLPGSENVISGNVTGIRVRGERTSMERMPPAWPPSPTKRESSSSERSTRWKTTGSASTRRTGSGWPEPTWPVSIPTPFTTTDRMGSAWEMPSRAPPSRRAGS
jgi:CSLREA domain-containing protein